MISGDRPAHHPTDSDFQPEAVRHQARTVGADAIDIGTDNEALPVDGTACETVNNGLSQNGNGTKGPADGTAFETVSWISKNCQKKLHYNRFTNLAGSRSRSRSKVRTMVTDNIFSCKIKGSARLSLVTSGPFFF